MHQSSENLVNLINQSDSKKHLQQSNQKESGIQRNVLITGGSRGIGSALVTKFANAGYTVWFTYFKGKNSAQQLVDSFSSRNVQAFALDLGDWTSLQNLLKALPEPVDILINNAALGSGTVKEFVTEPHLQDQALLQVNAVGSLWLTQEILPMMRKRKYGKIIFISSVGGGITQFPGFRLADSMSKAAITFLSKQLAAELSHEPIDIFTICPGATNTPMLEASLLKSLSADETKVLYNSLPGCRLIEPDEIAELALFLCTEQARILRGAVIDASLGLGVNPGTLTNFMNDSNQISVSNGSAQKSDRSEKTTSNFAMEPLDLEWIRAQFPALTQKINGQPTIFFDGPGATQVPESVLDAISDYLVKSNANAYGAFATSARTVALIASARAAMADFLGCSSDEVVFGANMTTLTFTLSRAIGRELQPGDEIIVTRLDHFANVSPWYLLEEQGAIIRVVDINVADCTLDMSDLAQQINHRTKLVAVCYASNAVGTINDIPAIVELAHAVGAWVFVDAVHYAPHGSINVHALGCDFLACSAYKFFGTHVGILYGKREHLSRLTPYKVKSSSNEVSSRWETGTLNYEGLAGVVAAVNYLAKLGCHVTTASAYHSRRAALVAAMSAIQQYERELSHKLISGLLQIPGLSFYGITDASRFAWRTPTVAIRLAGQTPEFTAKALGDRGIFVWHGHFYALNLIEKLGVEASGGLLRIGLVHYNTAEEIHHVLQVLNEIAALTS